MPDFETKALETTGSLAQSLVWQSKSIDPTGLYPMGARCYDPNAARFINADPLGHSATPDLYSYALGDPINFFDPTGRVCKSFHQEQSHFVSDAASELGNLIYGVANYANNFVGTGVNIATMGHFGQAEAALWFQQNNAIGTFVNENMQMTGERQL